MYELEIKSKLTAKSLASININLFGILKSNKIRLKLVFLLFHLSKDNPRYFL